jgi:hypothetical protein
MTQKHLTLADIYGSDPLAKALFERLKLKPFTLALLFILAGLLYAFALPVFVWKIEPASDIISILNIVLIFPVAGYFYAYQPGSILRVYQSVNRFLREEGEENEGHQVPYEKLRRWHARTRWWLAGLLFGGISAAFGILNAQYDFGVFWSNSNWAQIFIIQVTRFLAMAMIGIIASRHIVASVTLNNLLQYAQFPLTLDTERLEVFKEVRRFSLEIIGIIAVIGLNLGLQPLTIVVPMPEYAFYVGIYFLVAPVSFFLPLWQVHRRMVAIKEEMLDKMHKDFQAESEKLYDTISKSHLKDLPDSYIKKSEELTSIKNAIETIEKIPDWPFQGTTIYRMALTILSPFVLTIWDIIQGWVNTLFLN